MNIEVFRETNFKDTELGPLPEEWQVVSLGELATKGVIWLKNGFPQGGHNQTGLGIPHLRPFNITDTGDITLSQIKYVPSLAEDSPYWVLPGDIIFNNTNSEELVGKTAYFDLNGKFVLSNHMTLIRVLSKEVNAYWLAKYLHWLWSQRVFQGLCRRHVNQASISLERLKQVIIPLPPLPEQRAIAYVLRTVQEAKRATERVIAALRDLKKSLMRHLFTYGPMPISDVGAQHAAPLQDTEIGPIPSHWQVVRLGEVVRLKSKTLNPSDVPNSRYVGLEHINPGEVQIKRFGLASDTKSTKTVFNEGDILYGKLRPYLDKAALAEFDGVCSTDILVLSPKPGNDPLFVAYLMHSQFVLSYAVATTSGVNHPRTSWKALQKAQVPLPPLPEQQEIARILRAVDERIQAEEAYARALDDLFKSLLRELMSGRLRVVPDSVAQSAVGARHRLAPMLPTSPELFASPPELFASPMVEETKDTG